MGNHRIARIAGLIQIHVASLESVGLSTLHNRVSLLKSRTFPFLFHCWEFLAHAHFDGIIFNGTTLSIDTTTCYLWPSPGALNFFFARDVQGGSPKWPGALVFRGGSHPRKTPRERTFKTHPKHVFSRWVYRTDPKYVFSVLICSSWFTGGHFDCDL